MQPASDSTPDPVDTEQLRQRRDDLWQEISELRERWTELGNLADPQFDQEILVIFARLNVLEYQKLPEIERQLRDMQRAVERAA